MSCPTLNATYLQMIQLFTVVLKIYDILWKMTWMIYSDWFWAYKLSLNVAKTNFIIFNAKRTTSCNDINKLDIGNEAINRVTCTKFLGIYIDEDLEWTKSIDHVANKISSGCYAIRSAKHLLSAQNLRSLYFSLVHSHLTYGNMVWGSAYQFKLTRLFYFEINVCVIFANYHTMKVHLLHLRNL